MPVLAKDGDDPIYTYATYTPTQDCTLEITTYWFPWNIEYATSCDATEWTDIPVATAASQLGAYRWFVDVKKDVPYIFRVSGPWSTKIWVNETVLVKGESCETPFEGRIGMNKLPSASVTYYYSLQAPTTEKDAPDNFIEVKSSASLKGGSITLTRACYDPYYAYTVYDNFALRKSVASRQTCILTIVKPNDTETDEYLFDTSVPGRAQPDVRRVHKDRALPG